MKPAGFCGKGLELLGWGPGFVHGFSDGHVCPPLDFAEPGLRKHHMARHHRLLLDVLTGMHQPAWRHATVDLAVRNKEK